MYTAISRKVALVIHDASLVSNMPAPHSEELRWRVIWFRRRRRRA